jgi:diguanylate cyclase (GGDEF)-like protein
MPERRVQNGQRAQEITAVAARLGGAPDLASTLQAIAATARSALGADRATCYVHDVGSREVSAVYSTEEDPRRRAYLERAVGRSADQLPILRMQLAQADALLKIQDMAADPRVSAELAGRLGSGAFLGVRLEHTSVGGADAPMLLGTLFFSYAEPRRFSSVECQAARGLANLAGLALANVRLQAETAHALEENRAMAAEQASLRRVATRVAGEAPPDAVFGQAAEEVSRLLDMEEAIVARFSAEGATVVGTHGEHSVIGDSLPTRGGGALATVARTGAPAEIADYSALEPGSPLRTHALAHGYRASVAAPVTAAGRLWGALLATTKRDAGLPPHASERLGRFADLVALAIANAEGRQRLIDQAASDPLTGLANHRAFYESLHAETERAQRHGHPLSLVMLDLDHFKRINDGHGHPVGDRVLVETADRLRVLARSTDTLARIGGEEFAWLLPETDAAAAWSAAERARGTIAGAPFPGVGRVTASAGVAGLRDGGAPDEVVQAADGALYCAKARGRNVCVLHSAEEQPAV